MVAVLVVLIAALPAILSTAPARRAILRQANARLDGTLTIDRWSLGWRRGVTIDGIGYADGQGRFGATLRAFSMSSGLLSLLAPHKNLGVIAVDAPQVWVQVDKLEPSPGVASAPPPAGGSTGPAPAPGVPSAPRPAGLPPTLDIIAKLALTEGRIEVRQAGQPNTVLDLAGNVDCPGLREPLLVGLRGRTRVGDVQPPADAGIRMDGNLRLLKADGTLDPQAITGMVTVTATEFELGSLALAKVYVPALPTINGRLNAALTLTINGVDNLAITGGTQVDALALAGGALGTDRPRLDRVRLDVDVLRAGGDVTIRQLSFRSAPATFKAVGKLETVAGAPYPKGQVSMLGEVDLAVVAALVPQTLKLPPGVRVTRGKLSFDGRVDSDAAALGVQVKAALRDLTGSQSNVVFQQSAPIEAAVKAHMDATGPGLDQLTLQSSFASASGSGSSTGAVVSVTVDLAAALKEIAPLVDLGHLQAGGKLRALVKADLQDPKKRRLTLDAVLDQFTLTGVDQSPDVSGNARTLVSLTLGEQGAMDADGFVEASNLALRGGPLGKDQPRIDSVRVDADVSRAGSHVEVRALSLTSPLARAKVTGTVDTVPGATFPKLNLETSLGLELAALAGQFPGTMHLQPDVRLTEGTVRARASLKSDGTRLGWDAAGEVADVAATRGKAAVALAAPVQLRSRGSTASGGVTLDALTLTSGFASLEGKGEASAANLALKLDLDQAFNQLGQFIDFGKRRFGGQVAATLAMTSPSADARELKLDVEADRLELGGFTPQPIRREHVKLAYAGVLQMNAGKRLTGLRAVTLVVEGLPVALRATVASLDLPDASRHAPVRLGDAALSVSGTTEAVMTFCREIGVLKQDLPLSGPLKLDATISGTPDAITLQALALESKPLSLHASGSVSDLGGQRLLKAKGSLDTDCTEIALLTEAFTGYRPEMSGKASRPFAVDTALGAGDWRAILRRTEALAGLHADRFKALGIDASNVDLALRVHQERAQVVLDTVVNEGRVHANPYLDLTQAQPVLLVPTNSQLLSDVKLTDEMASELLAKIHPIFRGGAVLGGSMSLRMDRLRAPLGERVKQDTTFAGAMELDDLRLGATGLIGKLLGLARIEAKETVVSNQVITFECRDGRVYPSPLVITADRQPITLSGSIGLDQTLQYQAQMPVTAKLIHRETLPPALRNQTITVAITGTASNPRFDEQAFVRAAAEFGVKAGINAGLERYGERLGIGKPAAGGEDAAPAPDANATPAEPGQPAEPEQQGGSLEQQGRKALGDFLKKRMGN